VCGCVGECATANGARATHGPMQLTPFRIQPRTCSTLRTVATSSFGTSSAPTATPRRPRGSPEMSAIPTAVVDHFSTLDPRAEFRLSY
jgi:hypothetical protein